MTLKTEFDKYFEIMRPLLSVTKEVALQAAVDILEESTSTLTGVYANLKNDGHEQAADIVQTILAAAYTAHDKLNDL